MPQRDWSAVPHDVRTEKGKELVDGSWVAQTDAVDLLVGRRNRSHTWGQPNAGRSGGRFHILAELAAASGTPPEEAFVPTVNTGVDVGGGLFTC